MVSQTEFEAPLPGSWTALDRLEANHEAAHALAADLLSLRVFEVRIDKPLHPADNKPGFVYGHCIHQRAPREDLWKDIAVALAPLILANRCPGFPPYLFSDDGDERTAAMVAHDIGMTEQEWDNTVDIISTLLEFPSSKRKLKALSGALLEHGALPGGEVHRLLSLSGAQEPAR
jgi:hypothetical protein